MFESVSRSYKELPIRMADFGVLHINEISGALSGLTRVRRFQQDDAHIFCRYDQIMDEVLGLLDFMSYVYDVFGFKYELYLSTRPEKMLGSAKLWDMAEKSLADALNKFGKPWKINPGDGAFYGPKIDIKLFDALGRAHQCGTVQLDFQLPIRFNLMYKTEEQVKKEDQTKADAPIEDSINEEVNEYGEPLGKEIYKADEWDDEEFNWKEKNLKPGYARPCIVHRAILGSVERCSAILIEHYEGKFPFWLSPRQICICTVNNKVDDYAEKWFLMLKYKGYQIFWDRSSTTLQKKIRNAQILQYNYIGVIGQEEVDSNSIDIRTRDGERIGKKTLNELLVFFESLEPKKSKAELDLLEKVYENKKFSDLDKQESKLKFNLYLNGDEMTKEDEDLYEKLKKEEIDREKYPNLFKWMKLMAIKK
jgi:threonyl-tRNA synthetase